MRRNDFCKLLYPPLAHNSNFIQFWELNLQHFKNEFYRPILHNPACGTSNISQPTCILFPYHINGMNACTFHICRMYACFVKLDPYWFTIRLHTFIITKYWGHLCIHRHDIIAPTRSGGVQSSTSQLWPPLIHVVQPTTTYISNPRNVYELDYKLL